MEKNNESSDGRKSPAQECSGEAAAVEEYLELSKGNYHIGTNSVGVSENGSAVFRDITVWGGEAGLVYQDTVASMFMAPVRLIHKLLSPKKSTRKAILQGVDGIIHEGEMLLVLGRPGSGSTTLLKTLAGMTESFHGWNGIISYFGLSIDIIKKKFRGDVVYNAEGDVHFPYLTVLATVGFAVETKTPQLSKGNQRGQKVGAVANALLKVFGLEKTINTLVGNEFVHGVSGGERKRVSLAEVMSTNAKVSLWDNSTQGLDAATSIRFGNSLQAYTKHGRNIAVAALYQASDDLVHFFDKVTILYEGRQVFFGNVNDAGEYFISLGFRWAERQSLSEFLISVTDVNVRTATEGWEGRVPRGPDDFVKCWKESQYYRKLQDELKPLSATPALKHGAEPSGPQGQITVREAPPKRASYGLSWPLQLIVTLHRAVQRLVGDKPFLGASIMAPIFVSLIFGSAFFNTPDNTQGFFSRQGVIYFGILFNVIQTLGEITTQYAQRHIVQKQAGFAMYHPGIDAISSLITIWPVKLISVSLFNCSLYFMANLKREPAAFFIFLLFTFTVVLMMSSMFRFVAAINKHEATATSIAGILVLPLIIYTGYIIPRPSMHPWFKWISYINPMAYAFEALMANEFHDREVPCSRLIPSGPGYLHISPQNQVCPVTGSVPGLSLVSGDLYIQDSFEYYHSHLWRNYGILIAFFIFFLVGYALAVEFVPQVQKGRGDILIFLRHQKAGLEKKPLLEETALQRDKVESSAEQPMSSITQEISIGFGRLERSQDCFTWNNLDYEIPVKGGTKKLLTGIHGFVKPGTMTAMLGESGAGKTTLLNVLARRTKIGAVRGDIRINGSALDQNFARRTGFVESQDVHLSQFTVRETLRFSAKLRQPNHVSEQEKNEYVEVIIRMLEMEEYGDAVVGVPGSGLSLEQRKRLTIGVELVAKPSLIFLDEPTSGLDSQSSWSIIKCLRKLADSGQAILCTIHQPSSSLFEQFDRILLLQKGGRCVYFGDIGTNSETVIDYFESNGATKCSVKTNPAEYILQVTEAGAGNTEWATAWQRSIEATIVEQEITSLRKPTVSKNPEQPSAGDGHPRASDPTSFLQQFLIVQKRSFKFYWRSPIYVRGKMILNLAAGLFLGFTFYKENNSAQGLQNKLFAVFTSVVISAPLMNQLQPRFFEVQDLYIAREEPPKMFHWSIFVITTAITEIITNIVTGTLFFLPWYFAVGFWQNMSNRNARGAYQWVMLVMFQMWVSTFGQLLAAFAPNAQIAAVLIPLFFVFVVLFCGVLQPLSQLPKFWHFVHYASPFTWLVDGLLSNVLHDTVVTCTSLETNIFQPPAGQTCGQFLGPFLKIGFGALYNPNATANCEYCRYSTGDQYLATLDYNWGDRWRNFGLIWVYVFFNLGMLLLVAGIPRVLRKWRNGRKEKGGIA